MSSGTKADFYSLIVRAQQRDSQSDYGNAFVLYLDGINALTHYLKTEALNKLDTIGSGSIDHKLVSGINTLSNCTERLLAIINQSNNNNNNASNESEDELVSKLSHHSLTALRVIDGNETDGLLDRQVNSDNSFNRMASKSTNLQKALKENAYLQRVFDTRLQKTGDPFKRASLKLELQRRITENIELAKNKDKELFHSLHLEQRKSLEAAAKKLVQQQSVLSLDNESMIVDNQSQQQLYAQILEFESKNGDLSREFRCLSVTPDKSVITQIIIRILKCREHPLTHWIDKFQTQIVRIITPLLKQYIKRRPSDRSLSESDVQSSTSSLQSLNSIDLLDEMDVVISDEESEALVRHLNNIATDISISHETITLMLGLIMFDNHMYYKPDNYDLFREQHYLVHLIISHYFYPPIWSVLKYLSRIAYHKHERELREGINEMIKNNESNEELSNLFDETIINDSITSLKGFIDLHSPYEKLKSLVRLIQELCSRLKSDREGPSEVSADDLIPALCQVVIKSGFAQLIPECYAIEQLVDQKYLLGEEGYCLSSLMTALKYIQMHCSRSDYISSDSNEN